MESGRRLEKMLPLSEMVVIPGVGHLPYEESPQVFADAVNSFLHKLDRGEVRRGPQLVRPHL
jgi:pimeloyl-ACP methyl ester carboxylesterase